MLDPVIARPAVGDEAAQLDPSSDQADMPSSPQLAASQVAAIMQTVPGGAANVQDIYALSPLQEGMLLHRLLGAADSDAQVLSVLFELDSSKRVRALVDALQRVLDRHDVLRTAVLWEQLPKPIQVVYRRANLTVEPLTLAKGGDIAAQLAVLLRPRRRCIDLRRAPLLRLQVTTEPRGGKWYALIRAHHVVCDHRSMQAIAAEVMALVEDRESDLPTPVAYRSHLAKAPTLSAAAASEAYFREALGDVDESTAPFDLTDVQGDGDRVDQSRLVIEPALACMVRAQARRCSTTPAQLFHAAWALVVAHTSGRDDVVFGTVLPDTQRRGTKAREPLGMTVGTLPLRLKLRDMTARRLVLQTDASLEALILHEQTPLAAAQRCSGIKGNAPLFTTLLNYRHSAELSAARLDAAGMRVIGRGEAWTNYPIAMIVEDCGDTFEVISQTDPVISAYRVAEYLSTAVRSLAEALDRAPQAPALELSVLPPSELHQLLCSFNDTEAGYPQEKVIHELFEEQVSRTPDAVAVVFEEESLTYAQLNARANQLARSLRSVGIDADHLVGLCVERSFAMVVGLLGILKAGGAYVPLDPTYPPERIQYMVEDAAPAIVLTQHRLKDLLRASQVELLVLDEQLVSPAAGDPVFLPPLDLSPAGHNLLYVIYTSGSTGRPKATAMPHRAMANLLAWHGRHLPLRPGQRVLQFAALSFDVAFQEMFTTLCGGGTLVLLDERVRRDARALLELLREKHIERLFVPPVLLQSLAEYSRMAGLAPTSLRDVIVAGEQLRISQQLIEFFKAQVCRLHNHYGPTETHVVTALTLEGDPGEWPTLPPIGRPISNVQIFILNARRQPVPVGVVGEVYIAGANTARGYLNRPELTAERFVTNPFHPDPQARMYKTGDLARWRKDGVIEYLGRNDDQVKIRGFRVELGEVEAQLVRHPQVKEAAVIARENGTGEKRLIAYVTLRSECGASVDELNAHLTYLLPDYMVPSAFVVLNALPLTPSGKVNRRALPAPAAEAYAVRQHEPPQGEVETALAAIWSDLLGVGRIGRHDNFFKLGGNSISAVRLAVRVLEAFAAHLTAVSVFRYPLLREMAQVVEISRFGERPLIGPRDQPQLASGTID